MAQLSVDGAELFYETLGRGPLVMTMHGGLGFDHTYFRPWLDPLAERATVAYYDHRGNGRSSRGDLDRVDHATWADDADRLRAALGHDRMVLFGHSYGGFLAQQYALRHPERLRGLVLCDTAPAFDYPDVQMKNAQARGTPEQLQALQQGMSGPSSDDAAFAAGTLCVLPMYFHHYRPAYGEAFARMRFSAAAFSAGMFRCLPRFNTLARLGEIRVPTLILAGRDDWITPPAQGAERLHHGIAGSRQVLFDDSGHYPFIEEPARFVQVVGDWLSTLG